MIRKSSMRQPFSKDFRCPASGPQKPLHLDATVHPHLAALFTGNALQVCFPVCFKLFGYLQALVPFFQRLLAVVPLQIMVVLFAFISCIRHYFLISERKVLFHFFQERDQRSGICRLGADAYQGDVFRLVVSSSMLHADFHFPVKLSDLFNQCVDFGLCVECRGVA